MEFHCTYIPYQTTGCFSPLVTDYVSDTTTLQPFFTYQPDINGIKAAIADREQYPVNRELLVNTLKKQYTGLPATDAVDHNINQLANDNTYTICTAHQPNLLTGYLYFIYKIAHAISLANALNEQYPDKHFVPVYYMGSEDNDLDELGVFRYQGKKYRWDANGQTGAVGRMTTKNIRPLLDELFRVLGPPGEHTNQLKEILTTAYTQYKTIGAATQYLVHMLFGQYGLVVLNPDEAGFKKEIVDIMEDDLLNHTANNIVSKEAEKLATLYKSQAYPRDINLFYLHDQLRERIERNGDKWTVLNTDISWTKEELLEELHTHPERFSPNVILRGILQEKILPDVAFIGGGAEVAYWLQLNEMFNHYGVFYPVILLRQSALWIEPRMQELLSKTGLSNEELFTPTEELIKAHVIDNSTSEWSTNEEQASFEQLMTELKEKATRLDPTLSASADAALAKIRHQLTVLEKKMLRAEKRKHQTDTDRITRLKELLFPNNSLQERVENFVEYYPAYGQAFIDTIINNTHPVGNDFLVISAS